jgi:long-chain acyl-CoA synthetase
MKEHALSFPSNVRELVELSLEDRGDQPCILWRDSEVTYRELNDRVNRVANGLKSIGVKQGDVVSVYLPNCPDYYYAWFGIIKLGAVFGPINALFKGDEVRHVLSDSGAVAVITSAVMVDTIKAAKPSCPALQHVICLEGTTNGASAFADLFKHSAELAPVDVARDDLAEIVYTSGTTGRPKGAMLTHWNCISNAAAVADLTPLHQGEGRLGLIMPLFHVNAQGNSLVQFLTGGCVAMWERFSPSDFWETVDRYKPKSFSSVPTMLSILLSTPVRKGLDISSLDFVGCGAAPLPLEIIQRFERDFGLRILEGYGLTEGTCVSSLNPYWSPRKVGSIGLPIRGQAMRIFDDNGNEPPAGKLGEIVIKGPNVMKGYYNNPQATAETIVDGWLHTGDVGYVDDEGYFFIVDRKKDMIIRGGENIYPREIEEVLFTHPQIAEASVVGRKDIVWGEEVVAVIVAEPDASLTVEDVISFCAQHLADFKLPREVVFLQELPKTPTGKVQKKALKDQLFGPAS